MTNKRIAKVKCDIKKPQNPSGAFGLIPQHETERRKHGKQKQDAHPKVRPREIERFKPIRRLGEREKKGKEKIKKKQTRKATFASPSSRSGSVESPCSSAYITYFKLSMAINGASGNASKQEEKEKKRKKKRKENKFRKGDSHVHRH
jgi:hypothetical protein